MQVFFESQDLWNLVENGFREPESPTVLTVQQTNELKENKRRDRKALYVIFQAVDESIFERISTSHTSKEAWDALYKTYRGEDKVKIVRLQTLRCEFDGLRMRESESVEEFYNRVIVLTNQLRINGEDIEDKRIVEKILRSLTQKFEYVVVAIEESKDVTSLSLESLLGTLQSHELRMRRFDDTTPLEQALRVSTSKDSGEGPSDGKRQPRPLSEIQCYYCHKYGHTMKHCKKRQEDESEDAKFMDENDSREGETLFMTFEIDDLVKNDDWKKLTANEDLIVAVEDAIHGKDWMID